MEMAALRYRHAGQRPEECRIRKQQGRRKVTAAYQPPGSVNVGQQQIQQLRPLDDAGLDVTPFFRGHQQWNRIDG